MNQPDELPARRRRRRRVRRVRRGRQIPSLLDTLLRQAAGV